MTHRSQMSLTSVMATLYFCLSGNNGRHLPSPSPSPQPNCLHSSLWDRSIKRTPSNYHISFTFAKQIATPATCGCPWRLPETTCVNPLPPQMHTHTRATWCHWSGAIEGKPKSKVQILKIKGLADGPSFPPLSLCVSLSLAKAGMLLIKQPPQPGTTDAD